MFRSIVPNVKSPVQAMLPRLEELGSRQSKVQLNTNARILCIGAFVVPDQRNLGKQGSVKRLVRPFNGCQVVSQITSMTGK